MSSATTLTGNTVKISTPQYDWEKVGSYVNEGPAAIYHGGRTWIVYSASGCAGSGYKLGQLELTGSNPLSASSWTKKSSAIFQTGNGQYQPGMFTLTNDIEMFFDICVIGHNGFFVSPSGNQIWNVSQL
jgi:GH43 family beta-xylosidase